MKNAVTRTLYDYWTRLRGDRAAPSRFEIEPGAITAILGDTFILEAIDEQTYNFRLAGTRLCAAYGRELKGRNLLDFWIGRDRETIAGVLASIVEEGGAAVIGLEASNERGQKIVVEVILMPLTHDGPDHTRMIGSFAPMEQPYWLGVHPIVRQPVQSLRMIWAGDPPNAILRGDEAGAAEETLLAAGIRGARSKGFAPARARRVGHLRVFEGGRT